MLRRILLAVVAGLVGAGVVVAVASPAHTPAGPGQQPSSRPSSSPSSTPSTPSPSAAPLAGTTVALDPGHQLGNGHFPRETTRIVDAGTLDKACNTVGTATDAGLPEATVNFRVAKRVARQLRALGATVRMTRTGNSARRWGPCVDVRGRFGGRVGADLTVSIHADGAGATLHGFHVIIPSPRSPDTADIGPASRRLGLAIRAALDRAGIARSDYVGAGTALSVRADLGTLNLSTVPVVMVELGNLRNAVDARRLSRPSGERRYADALVAGVRAFLGR